MDTCYVSIREASKISGLCPQTLRKMGDDNIIECYKTSSGQRKFSKNSLEKMCQKSPINQCSSTSPANKFLSEKQNFIYARVSSEKNIEELSQQIDFIKNINQDYNSYTYITDYASGFNLKRKGLSVILDACLNNNIGEIVITHEDILSRYHFDIIKNIVDKCGGRIIILGNEKYKSTSKDLLEDLLFFINNFINKRI